MPNTEKNNPAKQDDNQKPERKQAQAMPKGEGADKRNEQEKAGKDEKGKSGQGARNDPGKGK